MAALEASIKQWLNDRQSFRSIMKPKEKTCPEKH
jgi:hypothetical protein